MSSLPLYPLKFESILKEKIWGGTRINTHLHKDLGGLARCGESWEVSGVDGDISRVSNGALKGMLLPELIATYEADLLGTKVYQNFGLEFPLLIKFIDANEDLSVQVHPNDILARKRHHCNGKTEMWYVINADQNATLYTGFKKNVTKKDLVALCTNNNILSVMNKETAAAGDVFLIPSGRVHSIGAGILLAEIQQTSDITYRIYDFERKDKAGNKRDLHISEALDAIDYSVADHYKTRYKKKMNGTAMLVECEYFITNLLDIEQTIHKNYDSLDSFKVFICLGGEVALTCGSESIILTTGETTLIPACFDSIKLSPSKRTKLIECYLP